MQLDKENDLDLGILARNPDVENFILIEFSNKKKFIV